MMSANTKGGRRREWSTVKEFPKMARPKLPTNFAASTSHSVQPPNFSEIELMISDSDKKILGRMF